ncbi:hypothetical protein JCM18916_1059 [Cutibacterium acnes JCM 18916]|nr:hypothetical protein JCM18916_1059 [Cutibacterium acnes JCM 18916]
MAMIRAAELRRELRRTVGSPLLPPHLPSEHLPHEHVHRSTIRGRACAYIVAAVTFGADTGPRFSSYA